MSQPRLGFVGVGLMGHGMAKHLLKQGHQLSLYVHRNRAPIEDLLKQGAQEAGSLKELAAASDMVLLCVSNSEAVEQALFGEDGLLAGAAPGTVFIDTGTSRPAATREVNARLRAAGMLFADAPLTRSPAKAEEGALGSFASCERELMDRIEPVLACYSEVVLHVGEEVGQAHQLKLINNSIGASYIGCWSEAYSACMAAGIEPKQLHAVVSTAGMNCVNFQNYSRFVLEGTQEGHKFAVTNLHKDMNYYQELARELGMSSPIADAALQLLRLAMARGYGEDYATVLPKVAGELNGTPAADLPRGRTGK